MQTINPATEQPLGEYQEHTDSELQSHIQRVYTTFVKWRETSFSERATKLKLVADQLRKQSSELAMTMVQEMGKPIQEANSEIEKCALVCEFYSQNAEKFLSPEAIATDATKSYVRFDPLGPVLAVMPWNFPFWQVFRFAAPTLMAGNTCLLKHATNVTGCAVAIERIIREAGFPAGAFTTLLINSKRVAEVISNPAVRAVTLTGSDAAGRSVAAAAGQHLKKCVLELGGSDPFIVLADANLETTASQAAKARMINTGQSCIAAKRFLVEDSIADAFTDALVAEMENMNVGDPKLDETQVGPLAREDLCNDLNKQVQKSIEQGARLMAGGLHMDRKGYYFQPTVLANVVPGMPAFDEELFGPVAAVICVSNADEAVQLANQSNFGLGASIWTKDTEQAQKLAVQIESGAVFINEIVKSDPHVPFGGIKDSGFGRELSHFGIREFVNIKTVWVA